MENLATWQPAIDNYEIYNRRMSLDPVLTDKLFFLHEIDMSKVRGVLDYGCANGALLTELHKHYPYLELYGLDIDSKMLELATTQCSEIIPISNPIPTIDTTGLVLNLSSVIHEIYTYCDVDTVEAFWQSVNDSNFEYITIRDMCLDNPSSNDWEAALKIREKADKTQLDEFENIWGSIFHKREMLHYLLKHEYVENWNREVQENYLPIDLTELLKKLPLKDYDIIHMDMFALEYHKQLFWEKFGIRLTDTTHVKLILKRKRQR